MENMITLGVLVAFTLTTIVFVGWDSSNSTQEDWY